MTGESKKRGIELAEKLEERTGGAIRAAILLRCAYRGGYSEWRQGRRVMPGYIQASIEAHLRLPPRQFERLLTDRCQERS